MYDWIKRQNPRQRPQGAPSPQVDTSSFGNYLQQGHLPGMAGSGGNMNAEYAQMLGNASNVQQGNTDFYQNYMKNLMGQNVAQPFKNPYQTQMNNQMNRMNGLPNTQTSAQNWLSQYLPMMQQGGQMNFNDPQLRQTMLNPNAQSFMNGQSQANVYGTPNLGQGGQRALDVAQMQMPQGGGNGQGQQAGNQWMAGLTGLMNQPGMSEAERNQLAQSAFNPFKQQLDEALGKQLSATSASGLGRSSAATKQRSDYTRDLSNAAGGITSGLLQQDIGLRNQNRLAALAGLGQAQGQFTGQDQNQQGLAQNWAMNQGQLGMGLAGLNQQGQLATNQLNQGASNDAFNQNATRAGMGFDLYNQDANRALQEQAGNRGWQTTTQGMLADNQYRNAGMNNNNIMSLLGMGANAGQQDFGNQNQLFQNLLGAGNQSMNAWGQNQNNMLQQFGMRGDLANSLFGNQIVQYNNDRNFYEAMRQYGLNRQDALDQANKGGGIGGLLGGIGGTLLGSFLGPVGGAIGGSIGSSLFGQPQQQQRQWR